MSSNLLSVAGRTCLIVLATATLALTASCSDSMDTIAQDYARVHGGDSKTTAGAESTDLFVITATVDKGTASVSATFKSYGDSLTQGAIFFTDGTSARAAFKGNSGTVNANSLSSVWYLCAKDASGDYWYFDRSGDYWYFDRTGTWTPAAPAEPSRVTSGAKRGGTKPVATVRDIVSTVVSVESDPVFSASYDGAGIAYSADFPINSVTATYKQGDKQTFDTTADPLSTKTREDLGARGSDVSLITFETVNGWTWSYDTNLQFVWDGGTDSTRTTSGKQTSGLTTTSTGTYVTDIVTSYLSDRTSKQYSGLSLGFIVAINYGKPVDGYRLLKGDGSKWYFDNRGLKLMEARWFCDCD